MKSLSLSLAFICTLLVSSLFAQVSREYQLKAAFVYNFTQFVSWPQEAYPSNQAPLKIAVIGENSFGKVLEQLVRNELKDGRKIEVVYFPATVSAENLIGVQLAYFVQSAGANPSLLKKLSGYGLLMVGDDQKFLDNGGVILLYPEANKLKFKVNLDKAQSESYKISSKLLKMATIY